MLHTYLHLHAIRRTNGQSLGTFKKQCFSRKSARVLDRNYRVIKKSLCTWWLQYRKLQVMSKVSPASLQTFLDTRLTLTPSVISNSNYVIMVSDWNCLKYFCVFLYCNHQVHRVFLITLYVFCIQGVFMCFVPASQETAITFLYSCNWLVFITKTQCVFAPCRTGSVLWGDRLYLTMTLQSDSEWYKPWNCQLRVIVRIELRSHKWEPDVLLPPVNCEAAVVNSITGILGQFTAVPFASITVTSRHSSKISALQFAGSVQTDMP
jgi:hypothetical protein